MPESKLPDPAPTADVSEDEYLRFISEIKLAAVGMNHCECIVKGRQVLNESPDKVIPVFDMRAQYVSYEADGQWLMSAIQFFTFQFQYNEEPVLQLSCSYQADYLTTSQVSDAMFKAFSTILLPIQTIPYAREFFQSMSMRMNIPPITLPIFDPSEVARQSVIANTIQ